MIYLDVACNDPDNGNFAGRAPMLQLGSAEREAHNFMCGTAPRFADLGDKVRLAGKHWHCGGSKDWVGNWSWNRYRLMPPESDGKTHRWYPVDFVKWLRSRNLYRCISAPTDFFDWFNDGQTAYDHEILKMVSELEHEL